MKTKDILKLGMVLAVYAAGACVLLAGTFVFTKDAKEAQDKIRTTKALKELFPDLETFEILGNDEVPLGNGGVEPKEIYAVERRGVLIGLAITATGRSYQGRASVMTGVGLDGRIAGVKILELGDTPGLGMNAKKANYYINRKTRLTWFGQFSGMGADAALEVGKDVQAVTASTITSKSLTAIIKASASAGAAYIAARAQGATE